jgi:hypothetical protein
MRNFLIALGVGITLAAHSSEPFSLKGYVIGSEQVGCPSGAVKEQQMRTGEIMCSMGPTTLANQAASDYVVVLKANKISGVMFKMVDRGRYANSAVVDALKAKYGEPTKQKANLNEFSWQQGSLLLSVDGYKGNILLIDLGQARKTQEESALSNKDDL